jgi:hypothetical protein
MIAVAKLYACSPCVHAIGSTRSRRGSVDERKPRRDRSLWIAMMMILGMGRVSLVLSSLWEEKSHTAVAAQRPWWP